MSRLQIYDPRERALVATGDVLLAAGASLARPFRRRRPPRDPARVLLLRLERIGDLLMALPGVAAVRALAPQARIDLVVGSWNEDLARAIPFVDTVETLDAAWLARRGEGLKVPALVGAARRWRQRHYDLAINFEPDVRSNLMIAVAGASWAAGYRSAGGGALLDQALDYDPRAHTTDNAVRLVSTVFGSAAQSSSHSLLTIPEEHRRRAEAIVGPRPGPLIALHVSGGRPVKQWPPERFAEVARQLAVERRATILLTGSPADRPLIDELTRGLPAGSYVDTSTADNLLTVAALLAQADLLITGDTGPMHLAAAVGTPIVAVFGPSDPRRYAPRGPHDRVVRVDLACAPCNRIRLPPARCRVGTPDCLMGVSIAAVLQAANQVLDR